MKNIKSLISLVLTVLIIFVSGCSNVPSAIEKDTKDNTNDSTANSTTQYLQLTEINNLFTENSSPVSVDISGDNILILSIENDSNSYHFVIYSVKENKVISQKSVTYNVDIQISEAKFYGENQIIAIDINNEKSKIYDFDFNLINEVVYKYDSPEVLEEKAKQSPFVNGRFGYYDEYAVDYENKMKICVFYNNPDYAFVDKKESDQILDSFGKRMLCVKYYKNGSGLEFSVDDYEKALCINTSKINAPSQNNYVNPVISAINDKYVCVICEYSGSDSQAPAYVPFIWEYSAAATDSPIDVKAMSQTDFEKENSQLIDNIKKKYTINVYVDREIDYSDYVLSYGVEPYNLYLLLTQLDDALSVFPDNFISEMYSDLDSGYDFNINIVKNIDSIDAFAFAFERFEITFSTDAFYKNLVYHEMMHLIYERINNYYNDKGENFYALWEKLNDGIEYNSEAEDVNDEYFVSNYAMTNADEDMAETFKFLCETSEYDEMPDWLKKKPANKKAVFLCETIRKVYPSVSATERAYWEKFIDLNNQ